MFSKFGALALRRAINRAPQTRSLGASIPVILLEDIDQGREGEIVRVKRGFMRNYLIPRKKACYLTDENKLAYASKLEKAKAYEDVAAATSASQSAKEEVKRELIERLKSVNEIVATAKTVNESSNLYGGISAKDVCLLLREQFDLGVNESSVKVEGKIETTGIYKAEVLGVPIQLIVVAHDE